MKSKLVAIAAFLAAVGAGTYFVNWNTGTEDTTLPDSFGALESYDKSRCVVTACGAAECVTALAHLQDAGVTNATLRFIECPMRIGQRARNLAADAGLIFSASKYQEVKVIAMRVPADGGGFAFGIATNNDGWPMFAVTSEVFPCAWKPNAGATCTRLDGGNPGLENTMLENEWVGAGCQRKACLEVAGDSSAP